MPDLTNPDYLLNQQYKNAATLNAGAKTHPV